MNCGTKPALSLLLQSALSYVIPHSPFQCNVWEVPSAKCSTPLSVWDSPGQVNKLPIGICIEKGTLSLLDGCSYEKGLPHLLLVTILDRFCSHRSPLEVKLSCPGTGLYSLLHSLHRLHECLIWGYACLCVSALTLLPLPLAPYTVLQCLHLGTKALMVLKLEGALLSGKSLGMGFISPNFRGQPGGRLYMSGSFCSLCTDSGNGTFRTQFIWHFRCLL